MSGPLYQLLQPRSQCAFPFISALKTRLQFLRIDVFSAFFTLANHLFMQFLRCTNCNIRHLVLLLWKLTTSNCFNIVFIITCKPGLASLILKLPFFQVNKKYILIQTNVWLYAGLGPLQTDVVSSESHSDTHFEYINK